MEGDKDEQSSTLPEEQQQAQKTPEKSTVTTAVGEETTPTKTATPTTSTPAVVSPPTSAAISVSRVNVAPSVNDSNNKNSNDVEVGNSVLEPAVGHTAAGSTRERDVEVDTLTESHPSSAENTRLQRKWEFFPGKNHFYCDGRVMTAPSIRFCMLSFALILLTFVLFIIFDAPFLTERLSVAIPIVGSILFVSVIVNMIKTSFSDPGILPRASQQEADYLEKSYYNTVQRPPPRTKDIIVNGQVIKSKYCFTCKMFRPPRASHCSVCDNCVDRFDHHCPFLGNCIGKRNYRSFYTFIVSLSFLAVFVLSASIAHLAMLSKERGNFLEALRDSPGSAVVIIISFFGMWTVLGLSGFHTYLIAVEQTTNEDIKGLFGRANAKNPFSQGNFCQNCCFVLCGPSQPSLIDPRGFATPEFIAALPRKGDPNGMLSSGQIPQQNMVKPNPTINNCSNDQQHGPGPSVSYVGVTSGGANFYREHPPPAAPNMVQPIQHQPLHMSTSQSSTSELNNGGLIKSGFPSLPSIPPEEKILIKGQTRNGRPADFRQTIPESSALEEMSPEEMLISPSAASTVSLSTVSTSNMSSSNDYDTVSSPQGRGGGAGRVTTTGASSSSVRLSQQSHYQRNNRNVSSTKRLFPSKSSDHLEGIVDPSDFDDDLDMPSLTNINEDRGGGRRGVTNNFRGATSNANNNGPVSTANNGLTKSTRSLPSTSAGSLYQDPNEINKIHVLESYPSSSKSSVCSKAPSTARKFGNSNGNSGRQVGNKRGLESTMQNSPLHLDTIM